MTDSPSASGRMMREIRFPADADFYEEVLLGHWPLLEAHAAARGKSLVWAAVNGEMSAKATNNWRRLLWMEAGPEFITWGDLVRADRHKPGILNDVMIVGDADFEPGNTVLQMYSGDGTIRHDAIVQFIQRLAGEPGRDMVFLHREAWHPAFDTAEMIRVSERPPSAHQAADGQTKSGGCFIATACCGSAADPLVRDLQRFRDEVLISHRAGAALAAAYARWSPPLADWIRERAWARSVVRRAIVAPLAWLARARISRAESPATRS